MERDEMQKLTAHTDVKAEKIRILFDAGVERSEIANFMNISYQHVHNVLKRSGRLSAPDREPADEAAAQLWTVPVGAKGRIVLPEDYLSDEGLNEGDTLICRRERDGIHIMTRQAAAELLRARAFQRMPEEAALFDALLGDTGRLRSS